MFVTARNNSGYQTGNDTKSGKRRKQYCPLTVTDTAAACHAVCKVPAYGQHGESHRAPQPSPCPALTRPPRRQQEKATTSRHHRQQQRHQPAIHLQIAQLRFAHVEPPKVRTRPHRRRQQHQRAYPHRGNSTAETGKARGHGGMIAEIQIRVKSYGRFIGLIGFKVYQVKKLGAGKARAALSTL